LGRHLPGHQLGHVENTGQVDVDDALPICRVDLQEVILPRNPRHICQHVDAPPARHRRIHRCLHVRPLVNPS